MAESYFFYWGKASSQDKEGDAYHLLPFHALDVAACARKLLDLPHFSLRLLAEELGWPQRQVEALFVFFMALHDQGKFARAFQGVLPEPIPGLAPPNSAKSYEPCHDTLGWWLWMELVDTEAVPEGIPSPDHGFWEIWMRATAGHHGKPPLDSEEGGIVGANVEKAFMAEDLEAARRFMSDVKDLILQDVLPLPKPGSSRTKILKKHSWRLAGLGVLADWLGSNQSFFPYRSQPLVLSEYWPKALEFADKAVASTGLAWSPVKNWDDPTKLFDYLKSPTPLQNYAATVELEDGPQLFLLEDVTGAGKTEAALILTQRLMQAGLAQGLYFALPSMATSNQMYRRVGEVYRRLYREGSNPSLVLSHGARQLVKEFKESVLQSEDQPGDRSYQPDESSASAQCNAWLADNRKKALLAEVGVGTLDQALLAVLPARHQSLRLIGLSGKVFLVDEVHAYDDYMMSLLRKLLMAHASQGGSVILLSATLPLETRERLIDAYRRGLGIDEDCELDDNRYPLATQIGKEIRVHACETRPQLKRRVQVSMVHDENAVLARVSEVTQKGGCVAWIRNTVADARKAYSLLQDASPDQKLMLFHSRYAMGDRLEIEERVLDRFGKRSGSQDRAGWVLVGTQVLEQSLDFDVDLMISDLAPIDLIIQRAGRLHRHLRQANGDLSQDGRDGRSEPELIILSPSLEGSPDASWYKTLFPTAADVYPDAGKLWLGANALKEAGNITTPGEQGEPGAVRHLVEAVYGADLDSVPDKLRALSLKQIRQDMDMRSQANFNALEIRKGYCMGSSARWYEDDRVPTRLGDETLNIYLAVWQDGVLRPLRAKDSNPWEQSAVRVRASVAQRLADSWQARFASAIETLRAKTPLLRDHAFILPLIPESGELVGRVVDERGRELIMKYSADFGMVW